ncbi:unnamed protein product [Orchesella dallaii]|uniref:4a-hydroxytetrahydrobiopterin dehydratase n=1 Tax=Orchesella dallaii TaxID=48710 RepID=A0ABP1QY53_9HEXA
MAHLQSFKELLRVHATPFQLLLKLDRTTYISTSRRNFSLYGTSHLQKRKAPFNDLIQSCGKCSGQSVHTIAQPQQLLKASIPAPSQRKIPLSNYISPSLQTTRRFAKMALSPKLEGSERTEKLNALMEAGWTMVEGRDAIYKEFKFKNFNQVKIAYLLPVVQSIF